MLARTAFHTRTLGLYMAALIVIALATGRNDAAMVTAGLGLALIALLYLLAWFSARSTLYILTDVRLIMRIGMAIETRINIPLKQIKAAHYRARGKDHGDIAFELNGERMLGHVLLWPHVRPWRYAHPQPMLRAVPDAAGLARMIAETRAQYGEIERNLSEIKDAATTAGHHAPVAGPVVGRAPAKDPRKRCRPRVTRDWKEHPHDRARIRERRSHGSQGAADADGRNRGDFARAHRLGPARFFRGALPFPEQARAEAGIDSVAMRTLRFFDEPDGTVRVEDGATAEVLGPLRSGTRRVHPRQRAQPRSPAAASAGKVRRYPSN